MRACTCSSRRSEEYRGEKEDVAEQKERDDCMEATGRSRTARENGEETEESRTPAESRKEGSGRIHLMNVD
ncbi:hypothetical protein NDU88_002145 [Pleurodeles waltl]|uniref:Uncharacterized protein n=1 Tax=Pleurodeles waltl TaxID=8319 RepID=A0AAV7RCY0_PLEWA|nr:hypothetical protein NDU88_002145 [Pleurodeles waltl]